MNRACGQVTSCAMVTMKKRLKFCFCFFALGKVKVDISVKRFKCVFHLSAVRLRLRLRFRGSTLFTSTSILGHSPFCMAISHKVNGAKAEEAFAVAVAVELLENKKAYIKRAQPKPPSQSTFAKLQETIILQHGCHFNLLKRLIHTHCHARTPSSSLSTSHRYIPTYHADAPAKRG